MRLTRAEDYGILFMAELAIKRNVGFISVSMVAEEIGISRLFLNKIAQKLCRANLIKSKEGKGGGYVLSRDPAKINLTHIIRALGTQMYINECMSGCGRVHKCQYKKIWDKLNARIIGELKKMSLEEFVKQSYKNTKRLK